MARTVQRVLSEPAARELAAQLKALVTGNAPASFLAAYPKGAIYRSTEAESPAARFGGEWGEVECLGGWAWERLDEGDDGTAEQFLQSHPVGCVYETTGGSPAAYGGTWEEAPSLGASAWVRTS